MANFLKSLKIPNGQANKILTTDATGKIIPTDTSVTDINSRLTELENTVSDVNVRLNNING